MLGRSLIVALIGVACNASCVSIRGPEPPQEPNLRVVFHDDPQSEHFGSFELTALESDAIRPTDWTSMFTVRVTTDLGGPGNVQALVGSYEALADGVRFVPRFPPAPGVRYQARVELPGQASWWRTFSWNAAPAPSPAVESIYPSGETLPENALRLYVHFSEPMRQGEVSERIQLLDGSGKVIPAAFLVGPVGELWDVDMTRLTLLLDPGRIKRGVGPHHDQGPALTEGHTRTLLIQRGMRTAAGAMLEEDVSKSYRVVTPIRTAVRPDAWDLQVPPAGTREPVVVSFPRAMDHGMLMHAMGVQRADGVRISGKCTIEAAEWEWTWTPDEPWARTNHVLAFPQALEDVSGNNVRSELDVALSQPRRSTAATRHFRPAPAL